MRTGNMIGTASSHLSFPGSATAEAASASQKARARRIGPEAGHALEKLSHAIEYLTDELMNDVVTSPQARPGRVEAIELLMSLNRQIYFDCPGIIGLRDRLRAFLRRIL